MNKSWRSAWCTKAELSDHADSETTKEAPHAEYVLPRTGCSQENDQLLREGWKRQRSRRRCHFRHTRGSGQMDEDASAAVDSGDGSHPLHRLDLRSSEATCSCPESGASADVACHRRGQEEKRSHRCQQDCRLPAL